MHDRPRILVVDDEPYNVDYLEQELADLDYDTVSAANGQAALDQVAAEAPDLILLDIMMPVLDGFAVLARLKADPATRDIPVIIISAMSDLASVVRGIQQGAEDYLPKPFEPTLLQARLSASLANKRYRDQEREYLRQVERLTAAAQAIQANAFDPDDVASVAQRADALGDLARVFQRMAQEVHAREQRLRRQLQQLQLDIEERQKAALETAAVYLPMDRRQALARGESLPDRAQGAALFADISGFTPLTEALAKELGLQRGAEELTRQLNRIYTALIDEVHRYGGSVIDFSGDAITCWLNEDDGLRGTACALAMQAAMRPFATLTTSAGAIIPLAIKVAVTQGQVRRLLVGDPHLKSMDVLAGRLMEELAAAEHLAGRNEVVVSATIADRWAGRLTVVERRAGNQFAVVSAVSGEVPLQPWPPLAPDAIPDAEASAWVLPSVFEKIRSGKSALLSELRPAALLFLRFGGLDYDQDETAGMKLDAFLHWVERVVDRHDGAVLQLTVGDKGSYLYITFGAPVAHYDDAARGMLAALELRTPPAALDFISGIQIGLTHGQVRAGAYGSPARRSYGALGDQTNLAARLMMLAGVSEILCDDSIYQAAQAQFEFEPLPPITVKGKAEPIALYRPTGRRAGLASGLTSLIGRAAERALMIDRLAPGDQLLLKTASVIGQVFPLDLLRAVYPDERDRLNLPDSLEALEVMDLIEPASTGPGPTYRFKDALTHETAYNLMLFAQRRQLHRAIAEWVERAYADDLAPHYALLAHHWGRSEDTTRTLHYLEKAGQQAMQNGQLETARSYFDQVLTLEKRAGVLSDEYQHPRTAGSQPD